MCPKQLNIQGRYMLLFEPTIHLDLIDISRWSDLSSFFYHPWMEVSHLFAQQIEDPQIIEKMQKSWRNFIESGQVWALGIGFVLGYIFRTFTS
ncbi:hypothetical protein cce_0233 [Crocosphaera subtropica ATCC 51142]|uniref:Uncharacterized protein n=1 Tax=Crocosphaera subtropica (strain ATCC 51142 / BH68) TaxID=43989 RepID=B1X083_CROS5|nr:hypothetical protein [Crocosphaera subtropica]ACB49584.1 hypothetical protein cce_0233 [Crocosphaera subtropica ATCC 51142]